MASTVSAPPVADHRLGFQTLDSEIEVDSLPVEGEVPGWLAGSLLRTGPAKFEAGERSLNHWFDGLAMLHRFSFAGGDVSYANRYLRSRAYAEVDEHGRLGFQEFATDPCRSLFKRFTSLFSPALSDNGVVNISRLDDDFVAMTETPLPVVFDPHTLETAGVAHEAPGQVSTAHPHRDPITGEAVNFAVQMGPANRYRFFAQGGRDGARVIASTGVREPGYIHSFGITERFLVLAEFPLVVNPLRLALSGRPFIENYRWKPERGTRFFVFDRATGKLRRRFRGDACFAFHHVNAYEDGDRVVVDMCAFEDDEIIRAFYLAALRSGDGTLPAPKLTRFELDLEDGGLTREELVDEPLELPRIDYRSCNGRPHRYVYGIGSGNRTWSDRVVKADVVQRTSAHWHEDGCFPGEPVFVPAPDQAGEDDGVLLSVVLDAAREASFLLVLDAATLEELARARVPHHIPFGFHGNHFGGVR
jgi:beta,beta-carotene 9',10'-dioxygenase